MWQTMIRAWVVVAALFLAACTEEPKSSASIPPPPPLQVQPDTAGMYGLNVQLRYDGDSSAFTDSSRVYVFLRAAGERMPIAVQYFAVSELPKTVSFSGAPAGESLELVARLSPSGRVDRSPEDIEISQPVISAHPPENYLVVLGASADTGPGDSAGTSTAGAAWPPDIRAVVSESAATAQAPAVVIHSTVAIEASHPFPADTVVFVVARKPGQRMPTAVKRLSVADLPASVALTDADAMAPGSRLSDAAELELFARASTTGGVAASSGDWFSDTVTLDVTNLPEVINLVLSPEYSR